MRKELALIPSVVFDKGTSASSELSEPLDNSLLQQIIESYCTFLKAQEYNCRLNGLAQEYLTLN